MKLISASHYLSMASAQQDMNEVRINDGQGATLIGL